jgi:hypothetical protein
VTGLSIEAAAAAFVLGLLASIVGGAFGGIAVGGRALGNQLAGTMGSFFGPLAGAGGLIIGLIVLALIR